MTLLPEDFILILDLELFVSGSTVNSSVAYSLTGTIRTSAERPPLWHLRFQHSFPFVSLIVETTTNSSLKASNYH